MNIPPTPPLPLAGELVAVVGALDEETVAPPAASVWSKPDATLPLLLVLAGDRDPARSPASPRGSRAAGERERQRERHRHALLPHRALVQPSASRSTGAGAGAATARAPPPRPTERASRTRSLTHVVLQMPAAASISLHVSRSSSASIRLNCRPTSAAVAPPRMSAWFLLRPWPAPLETAPPPLTSRASKSALRCRRATLCRREGARDQTAPVRRRAQRRRAPPCPGAAGAAPPPPCRVATSAGRSDARSAACSRRVLQRRRLRPSHLLR